MTIRFAKSITHNLVQRGQTKHIEINRHFIKEKIIYGAPHLSFLLLINKLSMI